MLNPMFCAEAVSSIRAAFYRLKRYWLMRKLICRTSIEGRYLIGLSNGSWRSKGSNHAIATSSKIPEPVGRIKR
jgi:hypothetical protein